MAGAGADAARDEASFADFLERALASGIVARDERRTTALMRLATMPATKTLEQFDWSHVGSAPKAQSQELAHLVGKTHIALAIGYRAVMAGHKVRFISAADLMLQLAAAKAQGRLKEYFNRAVLGPKADCRRDRLPAVRTRGSNAVLQRRGQALRARQHGAHEQTAVPVPLPTTRP